MKWQGQKWDVCWHKSQVTKLKDVLPQITRDIFFLWKDKDKILVWADTITRNKGQGVLAQITKDKFFYERTRTKTWCGQAQITINRRKGVLTQITRDIVSFIIYLGSTSAAENDVKAGSPATSPVLGWGSINSLLGGLKTSIMLSFYNQMDIFRI